MKLNLVWLYALFSVLSIQAQQTASDAPMESLTVDEALRLASANNPGIQQLNYQVQSKSAEIWSSTGLASPQLWFSREGIADGQSSSFDEKRLTLSQSMDFPLRSYFRLGRVREEKNALEEQLAAEKLNLKAQVKKAYVDVTYAARILELREEEAILYGEMQKAAFTRVEVGESGDMELLQAEILLAGAENARSDAIQMLHQSRYHLFAVIGLDPRQQRYEIDFPDSLVYFSVAVDQDAILDLMTEQPDYLRTSRALSAASWGVREAWSQFLPDLEVGYFKQNFGSAYDHWGFEMGFKIPLWFFLQQRGQVQQARAWKSEISWRQREVKLDMKQQIETAWHSYETSLERIQRYHETIGSRAQRLNSMALEGYRAGEVDILELLEAQRTYLNSRKNYLDALRDYYMRLIDLEKYWQKELVFSKSFGHN